MAETVSGGFVNMSHDLKFWLFPSVAARVNRMPIPLLLLPRGCTRTLKSLFESTLNLEKRFYYESAIYKRTCDRPA